MKQIFWLITGLLLNLIPGQLNAQWQILNFLPHPALEVKFHDIDRGAALTAQTLLVTHNGGVSFDTVFYAPGTPFNTSLNMIDSTTIAFQKGNKLFLSVNSGTIWDSVVLPQNFDKLIFLNDTIVMGKAGNSLLRSNNRGVTWLTMLSGLSPIGFTFHFPHPDTGYVQTADTLRITYDGGFTWSSQTVWPGYRIYFPTDSIWYGVRTTQDSIQIIKTTDKGAVWVFSFQSFSPSMMIDAASFPDKETGYIGVHNYSSAPGNSCGMLLGTGDGGNSWDWHYNSNCFGEFIIDIFCLNADTVYLLEFNGVLYRNTNGTDYTRRVTGIGTITPLYEPCGKGSLSVSLTYPAKDTLVVYFDAMYGTAMNGTDFVHVPDSVIFLPGMSSVTVPVTVISDTLTEGPEFFSVVIHNTLYNDTATFWIHDNPPVPFTYQLNPSSRIVCSSSPNASFVANLAGGAIPYAVTWYDSSGILSQNSILPSQPVLPWHQTIFVEVSDNAMCIPIFDSVKIYFFDSCKVTILSSQPGQVPAGMPVTYTLQHSCPTINSNIRWLINQQLYVQNTNQIVYTWPSAGPQQVNAVVDHPCGFISTGIAVDVVTGLEEVNPPTQMQVMQLERRTWLISGENLAGKLTFRVMDMKGRLITGDLLFPEGGKLQHTLDLQNLAGGVYLIDIVSEHGCRFREKIVCR
jgi:photosystem II stability/assembly factor-like uncharacterized protein